MKTEQKIVNHWINEIIFPIKTILVIFGDSHFISKHTFDIQIFSIYLFQFGLVTFTHMLNGYEICFNRTHYPIFNMQELRYWPCTFIVDCFWLAGIPNVDSNLGIVAVCPCNNLVLEAVGCVTCPNVIDHQCLSF